MENKLSVVSDIINVVLANKGEYPTGGITEDTHLRNDLGLTSLDLAELTARIEAKTDIDVFEDGLVFTVGEILNKL